MGRYQNMAAVTGRLCRQAILKAKSPTNIQQANFGFKSGSKGKKTAYALLGAAAVGGLGAVGVALATPVSAMELTLHPPKFPWSHGGIFSALDMKSVRRGYEVYKQVCSACHSLDYLCYREMVDAFMTEDEAKAEANEAIMRDGPDEEGNMFERPGKLADRLPRPYLNDEAAMAANNGALPPDLTYVVKAREGEEDYIFSLLTGYCDAPAGVELAEDTHFNPYFPGGSIAMAQALYNEIIEYSDGTPATTSQLAKDVTTFLRWTSEPEHDVRKKVGIKCLLILGTVILVSVYAKKHYFAVVRTKKVVYKSL